MKLLSSISASLNSRAIFSLFHRIESQLFSSTPNPSNGPEYYSSLYKRITPLGDPNVSVVPVLDRWIREGNKGNKPELQRIVNQLRSYKRFKHALEVSLWMTNNRHFPMSPFDVAMRLKLIFGVFGIEKTEAYFDKIPDNFKNFSVYLALLNCYTMAKSVEKSEAIMQIARTSGIATKPIWYNLMMNLHLQLGNKEKVDDLLSEMESKGIDHDLFTRSIRLNSCAAANDLEGVDKIARDMESDPTAINDWNNYVTVVKIYTKMGEKDKALLILKKLEGQLVNYSRNPFVFTIFLNLYTGVGNKEGVYRVWEFYKKTKNVLNKVYMSMIRSLMEFGDFEGAEKIFEEWESSGVEIDFRVYNLLVEKYCVNGDLEKAEAIIEKGVAKGGKPSVTTWSLLAGGYLKENRVDKAVEALKKAILVAGPPSMKDSLNFCLEFLESGAYLEREGEVRELMRREGSSLKGIFDKLHGLVQTR